MDTRLESFKRKFYDANKYLGCDNIHKTISIKYRNPGVYSSYRELVDVMLKKQLGLDVQKIDGDFQGNAWIVKSNNDSVIIVEHETGLEILYIAGSIASLLSLIPLINAGWKYINKKLLKHELFKDQQSGIEVRVINSKNKLVEKNVITIEEFILNEKLNEIDILKKRVTKLENKVFKD